MRRAILGSFITLVFLQSAIAIEVRLHGGNAPNVEFIFSGEEWGRKMPLTVHVESAAVQLTQNVSSVQETVVAQPFSPHIRGPQYLRVRVAKGSDSQNQELILERHMTGAFVDYRFGRDNFRFANDRSYRQEVETYREFLLPWVEDRFGVLDELSQELLVVHAYRLLREQMGLCYAFAGSAVRYVNFPQQMPRFNTAVYQISEAHEPVRREMAFLQNDIVFDVFVRRGVDAEPMTTPEISYHADQLRSAVDQGELRVAAVLAPHRHHAMVAWGYLKDHTNGTTTAVLANNWRRNERDNFANDSVALVTLDPTSQQIEWINTDERAYRNLTHILIESIPEAYTFSPEIMDQLLEELTRWYADGDQMTVLFEGVQSVRWIPRPGETREVRPEIQRINNNVLVDVSSAREWDFAVQPLDSSPPGTARVIYSEEGTVQVEHYTLPLETHTVTVTPLGFIPSADSSSD